jgi:Na+/melibiose symporter-like transporter
VTLLLRERNFALVWLAGLVSLLGDWILAIGLAFHVYELTGSPAAPAALLISYSVPGIVLGSVAGVFVDRWDRRRTMIAANLLRAPLVLALLLVRSPEWVWLLFLVAAVESAIGTFAGPAENALLPTLVREEELVPANALNALNNDLGRLVGPAAGGAVLVFLGFPGLVLIDGASYLAAGLLVLLVRAPRPPAAEAAEPVADAAVRLWTAVWRDWLAGLRLIRGDRVVAPLFVVLGCASLADGFLNALWVVWVRDVLRGGALELGWIATAQGVGGVMAGAFVVGRLARLFRPTRLFQVGLLANAVVLLVVVNLPAVGFDLPPLPPVLALAVAGGVLVMVWLAASQTLLQTTVADEYRGRVFGARGMSDALLRVGGLGLSGVLVGEVGALPMINVAAGTYVLAGLLAFALVRPPAERSV